ncbi:MAG: ADP-heptose--LPS heptosyltransferase [Candidatus Accumulibacter sp.]|nr:ADP-heptose--LPS heptosyltransferase [Accumulibacter sp.]
MAQNLSFKELRVAIVPNVLLGDSTIGLRLAWIFRHAGARVSYYSSLFCPAHDYFPWLDIFPVDDLNLQDISTRFDFVLCHTDWLPRSNDSMIDYLRLDNVAYTAWKKTKDTPDLNGRSIHVRGHSYSGANRPICFDPQSGLSMTQWMDRYAHEVFGLDCPEPVPVCKEKPMEGNDVAIFPTSSGQQKNYSPWGWSWLAGRLEKEGWTVSFICPPREHIAIQKIYKGFRVRSFPDIKELMDYLSNCAAAMSNDSGGGHLASLLGVKTFTITRRTSDFLFRPGFGENHVLTPLIRLRLLGRFIWRPFIPVWRIPAMLGKAPG